MLRLLPDAERRCCPACRDVELRFIAACDGTSFLACAQCLRRYAAGFRRASVRAPLMPGVESGQGKFPDNSAHSGIVFMLER